MLNSVSGWYRIGGGVSQRELIDVYLTMIFRVPGRSPCRFRISCRLGAGRAPAAKTGVRAGQKARRRPCKAARG